MHFFAYSGLINGLFALVFGIIIISKNRRDKINQLFFLFTLAVALWAFSYWQWLLSSNEYTALLWVRILSIGSTFIPVFYFHWVLYLLGIYKEKHYAGLIKAVYAVAIIIIAFSFSSLFIKGVSPKLIFPFWPDPGILYGLYFVFIYIGLITYAIFLLFKHYRLASQEKKGQIFYVILGSIFGFLGGLTNFFLWYDIPIAPYGNILVAFIPFFLGYAILKHHLFSIKVVVAELLTFAIWATVFIKVFAAETLRERLLELGLFVLVVIFGILLIRSFLKLEAANERLKQLDKLKSEFLSFASHQIKAPMTVVKGYANMISDGTFGRIPEKVRGTTILIEEMVDRLVSLVNDFLNLRKIEEGKMDYQFSEINIIELIKSIVNELKIIAENKGLDLTLKLPPNSKEIRINADEQKLRQVIQNLIENAIKYTDKGFVEVGLKEDKNSVLFCVTDSGRGISKKLLPNLFQQFSRDASVKKIQGTGLGLYIAKKIIDAHHGKIWAESEGEGKGTVFRVRLSNY